MPSRVECHMPKIPVGTEMRALSPKSTGKRCGLVNHYFGHSEILKISEHIRRPKRTQTNIANSKNPDCNGKSIEEPILTARARSATFSMMSTLFVLMFMFAAFPV